MLRIAAFFLMALTLAAQTPSNWQAATVLPGVDMKRLTPAQQKVALKSWESPKHRLQPIHGCQQHLSRKLLVFLPKLLSTVAPTDSLV